MTRVRYMVDDVEAAIGFYTRLLGFELRQNHAPALAILVKRHIGMSQVAAERQQDGVRVKGDGSTTIYR